MPRITDAQAQARDIEIVDACEALYQRMSYKDVTMARIAENVSFSRTNIYNYFQSKEEIFLALLAREYEKWIADLKAITDIKEELNDERLARLLAQSLTKRKELLKIMSMNLFDIEVASRLEHLVAFKRTYAESAHALSDLLAKHKPAWNEQERETFILSLYPFMFGIYPYSTATDKQRAAMEQAGIPYHERTIESLSYPAIKALLAAE